MIESCRHAGQRLLIHPKVLWVVYKSKTQRVKETNLEILRMNKPKKLAKKNQKMVDAINISPGFAKKKKYNAEIVAEEIAKKYLDKTLWMMKHLMRYLDEALQSKVNNPILRYVQDSIWYWSFT